MNRYEREKPGTGGWRAAVNRYYNEQCAKHKTNDRGWVIPEEIWQGWNFYNIALSYAYRLRVLSKHFSDYERAEHIRYIRINLEQSRLCRNPRLP